MSLFPLLYCCLPAAFIGLLQLDLESDHLQHTQLKLVFPLEKDLTLRGTLLFVGRISHGRVADFD